MNLAAALGSGGSFAEGFVETHLALQKQQLLRDTLLQRERSDREELKLRKQEIDGRAAWRQLQERKFLSDLEAGQQERHLAAQQFQFKVDEAQQQQARQQAGSALGLLQADPASLGFQLDPQAQGDLQSIVTQQEAREGDIAQASKRWQDLQQRRAIIPDIDLTGLPEPQQQLGRAAISAFQQGRLSGDGLFQVLNRFGTSPVQGRRGSRGDLAMRAASGDAAAAKALELMGPSERSMSSAELSWRAAGGDERAQQALDKLQQLRTPPRSGRRKERTVPEPGPGDHPTTYRGSQFQGQGGSALGDDEDDLPVVKGFRRVR